MGCYQRPGLGVTDLTDVLLASGQASSGASTTLRGEGHCKITGILMVRAAQGPALLSRGWQERAVEIVPLQAAHGVRSFMGRLTPEQLHPAGG